MVRTDMNFFLNVFNQWLVDSIDIESTDKEGQVYVCEPSAILGKKLEHLQIWMFVGGLEPIFHKYEGTTILQNLAACNKTNLWPSHF